MEFQIDEVQKENFVKDAINSNRYYKKIYKSYKFLLTFGTILFILYLIHVLIVKEFALSAVYGYLFIVGISCFLRLLVFTTAGKDIWTRIDEKLTLQNGLLIYSYRERFKTYSSDRIRIYIPLDKLHKAKVENDGKTTVLFGKFSQKYISNCVDGPYVGKRPIVFSEKSIDKFVLYNYFSPVLAKHLIEIGELY